MRAATVATLLALVALTGCEAIYDGNDLHGKHNSDGGVPDLAGVDLAGVDLAGTDQSVKDQGAPDLAPFDLAGVDLSRHLLDLGRSDNMDGGIAPAQCPNGSVGTNVRTYDTKYATPNILARGDFNGDGNADVVAAAVDSNALVFLLGDGKGEFAVAKTIVPLDCTPNSMAVLDLNKDGRDDIVVACDDDLVSVINSKAASVGISFATPVHAGFHTPQPQLLATGNFDGNTAVADLVFVDPTAVNKSNQVVGAIDFMYPKGDGTLPATYDSYIGNTPETLTVGDLNSDGNSDLALGFNTYMTLFLSSGVSGDVTYTPGNIFVNAKGTVGQLDSDVLSATLGDFNKDGKLDIALIEPAFPDNYIQYALNTGTTTAPKFAASPPQLNFNDATGTELGAGDFDCNGYVDIFATKRLTGGDSGTFALYFPSNSGVFADSPGAITVASPTGMVIFDFNGDGAADAVVGSDEAQTGTNTTVTALISTAK